MNLTEEDTKQILSKAKETYKTELTRRLVERLFVDNKERVENYIAGASASLSQELKKEMPL